MNYITFDIETYSPSDLKKIDTNEFRVSVIGCYISWTNQYLAFLEPDVKDFLDLLLKADLVVGFNHIWFDLPVLHKYSSFDLLKLPSYDLLVEFEKKAGFKAKLDDLCKANFNTDVKTDSYEKFKNYHKEGKWFELIDYCLNDVRLTEKLFKMAQNQAPIKYKNLQGQLEVVLNQPIAIKSEVVSLSETIF